MQAFDGIRVLDFTHVYAGPFASYQLAVMARIPTPYWVILDYLPGR
jgi:hypothetical protein